MFVYIVLRARRALSESSPLEFRSLPRPMAYLSDGGDADDNGLCRSTKIAFAP